MSTRLASILWADRRKKLYNILDEFFPDWLYTTEDFMAIKAVVKESAGSYYILFQDYWINTACEIEECAFEIKSTDKVLWP